MTTETVRNCLAVDGLRDLEPSSVDLVLTDPPQGVTRAEFDVAPDWVALWPLIWRVLKPHGAAVVFSSSLRATLDIVAPALPEFRHDIVWAKNKATGFYNAKKAPLRKHETALVFYREPGAYTAHRTDGHRPMNAARRKAVSGHGANYGAGRHDTSSEAGTTLRYASSVLECPVVNNDAAGRIHPQQKPVELGRRLVLLYSRPGDVVVDLFAGSGAFVMAATLEGRTAVGFEARADFAAAANHRLCEAAS